MDDLAAAAATLPADLPLVVMTSHVLAYLGQDRRAAFLDELETLAADRPLWWVTEEAYHASLAPVLPGRDELEFAEGGLCALGIVRWDHGKPDALALARTAPHGQRLTWLPL